MLITYNYILNKNCHEINKSRYQRLRKYIKKKSVTHTYLHTRLHITLQITLSLSRLILINAHLVFIVLRDRRSWREYYQDCRKFVLNHRAVWGTAHQ